MCTECSAVQCSTVQCSTVQCSAVQCSAVQCSAVQYSVVQQKFQKAQLFHIIISFHRAHNTNTNTNARTGVPQILIHLIQPIKHHTELCQ